ncbi:MAG: choice-of-anchor tandem repeat GloVer-containing protein [Terriglobales bacterium]
MKNLKTQLAVLVLFVLCLFTGAYGQSIPGGHGATLGKASPLQSRPATSGPIVQEREPTKPPTYTVLYTFTGGADGAVPAGLIGDKEGNLYGTTNSGGNDTGCSSFGVPGCGVVFSLDGAGSQTLLYTFTGGTDGGIPLAGPIRDAKGNLYGTTSSGGGGILPAGTVFKLDNTGQMTVLHSFCSAANCVDGNTPYAGVIRHAGNLYGTTNGGGPSNSGVVFKLDPTGAETVLYSFAGGADGANPFAGLIRDEAGNLYGTTSAGGSSGSGTVFKVDPAGNETALYSFTGGTDGGYPEAGVIRDGKGNLYGTTFFGGLAPPPCSSFCGVVFKVDTTGVETVLYSFTGGADGENPSAGLMLGKAGDLYGTAGYGGADSDPLCQTGIGCGVVFKLTRR